MMWNSIPINNVSQKYYLAICPVMSNEKKLEVPKFKKSWQPVPNPSFTFPQKKKTSKLLVCFLIFSLALQTVLEALHKSRLEAFGAFLTLT